MSIMSPHMSIMSPHMNIMSPYIGIALLLTLFTTVNLVSSAKILMAAPQLESHVVEQTALGEELISRGHHVYIVLASRYPKAEGLKKRGFNILMFRIPDDVLYGVSKEAETKFAEIALGDFEDKMTPSVRAGGMATYRDCECMMADETFLKEVKRIRFDLAVVEPFYGAPCTLILPKALGIPFVSMTNVFLPWLMRVPALPSFVPIMVTWSSQSDITLFAKLKNLIWYAFGERIFSQMAPSNNSLLEKYAPEFSNWWDLVRTSEMFFVENDHHYGFPVPEMPYFISVAGLSTSKAKKLSIQFEEILNNSCEGVILFSFGSSAHYFPDYVVAKLLATFAQLNQTVIARLHIREGIVVPKNVKIFSWLPQNDILGHRNTKLFITHCGNNGQHEALYHGVPMIGFPLFAEQHRNCHRAYKLGFGLEMDIQSFTSEELLDSIKEVLQNSKYRTAIKKASGIFRDQPMHPRERAAFWIEHVIRHGGGKHLHTLAMDMPLYEFLMLDVIGFILAVVFVALGLVLLVCRYFYKKFDVSFMHNVSRIKLKVK